MPNEQCSDSFFDNCDNNKKHWTFEQLWRKLTAKVTGSDCPALRVVVAGTSSTAGAERTPSRTEDAVVGNNSIGAGAQSVTIETSEDFTGTILGATAQPNRFYTFAAKGNDTVGEIEYEITAGSIIINKLV